MTHQITWQSPMFNVIKILKTIALLTVHPVAVSANRFGHSNFDTKFSVALLYCAIALAARR